MPKYLILGLAASLALASCAAQKALPQYTEAEQAAQRGGISYWQPDPTPADSTPLLHRPPVWTPADSLRWALHKQTHQVDSSSATLSNLTSPVEKPRRRLLSLLPPKKVASSSKNVASDKLSDGKLPRKCKGCTFNVVNGDQHNQQVGKNGQALGASASNTQTGKKSGDIIKADSGATVNKSTTKKGQAAAGKGISQQHEEVKPGPWPAIIGGVGIVGGVGLVYWLVAGGGALWLAGIFKRRKPEAQA